MKANKTLPTKNNTATSPDSGDGHTPQPAVMPAPTYWPVVMALGTIMALWGIVTAWAVSLVGLGLVALALAGWIGDIRRES